MAFNFETLLLFNANYIWTNFLHKGGKILHQPFFKGEKQMKLIILLVLV